MIDLVAYWINDGTIVSLVKLTMRLNRIVYVYVVKGSIYMVHAYEKNTVERGEHTEVQNIPCVLHKFPDEDWSLLSSDFLYQYHGNKKIKNPHIYRQIKWQTDL